MTLCQPGELIDLRHAGSRQCVVAGVVSGVEPRLSRNIIRYRRVLAFTLYPVDSVRIQINYKRLSAIGRYYYLKRVRLNTNQTIHNAQNYSANFASLIIVIIIIIAIKFILRSAPVTVKSAQRTS